MTQAPATPAIEGWFRVGDADTAPALLGSRCTACGCTFFPVTAGFCRNPSCAGEEFATVELARRGRIWSYTDAQYQPPKPYIADTDPYEPFALAAVELPEGLVVMGQVARGYGVADLRVGLEVELVVERLYTDETGDRLIWRWRPLTDAVPEGAREQEVSA